MPCIKNKLVKQKKAISSMGKFAIFKPSDVDSEINQILSSAIESINEK